MTFSLTEAGIEYRGNLSWLPRAVLRLVRGGSHAYGTATEDSDLDLRGLAIPPKEYVVGCFRRFQQTEIKEPAARRETVIYDLVKYAQLAADANPNLLEILFCDDRDVLFTSALLQPLVAARELFLSRKCKHTYCGYAVSQLKRIRAHRRWLLSPPSRKPSRRDFGLPETSLISVDQLKAISAAIRKEIDSWELDLSDLDDARRIYLLSQVERLLTARQAPAPEVAAERLLGIGGEIVAVLDAERRYTSALREYQQYEEWRHSRNPARAALAAKHGYDTKHAMHLVRLMRTARELLTQGKLLIRRPDAEELLEIRRGAWTYDQLETWAQSEDVALDEAMKSSPLSVNPDRSAIDRIIISILEEFWNISRTG